jgi:hypothetical protein
MYIILAQLEDSHCPNRFPPPPTDIDIPGGGAEGVSRASAPCSAEVRNEAAPSTGGNGSVETAIGDEST